MNCVLSKIVEAVGDGKINESVIDSILIFYDFKEKDNIINVLNEADIKIEKDNFDSLNSLLDARSSTLKNNFTKHNVYSSTENDVLLGLLQELKDKINFEYNGVISDFDKKKYDYISDNLFLHNLRLVLKYSHRWIDKAKSIGLEEFDLYNEGATGLQKAIEKFSSDKGASLSSYAKYWIDYNIRKCINDYSNIHIPVYILERKREIEMFKNDFYVKNSRYPTSYEISSATNYSIEQINDIPFYNFVSLDSYATEDEKTVLGELIAAPEEDTEDFQNEYEKCLKKVINDIYYNGNTTKHRNIFIMCLYYGLDVSQYIDLDSYFLELDEEIFLNVKKLVSFNLQNKELTLREIGKAYNLSHERIRQILANTMQILKKNIAIYQSDELFVEEKQNSKQLSLVKK